MPKRQRVRQGIILVSFFLFPVTFYYFSPVLIIEASSQGIINGSFLLFAALFLSALVLGRGFCGWLCPGAGCQEAMFAAQPGNIVRGKSIKWWIWVPWMGGIAFCAIRAGGYHVVNGLYRTQFGFSVTNLHGLIVYLAVLLLLIVLPGLLIGRRSFCHHLCWMAPFMILGRKTGHTLGLPRLHLQKTEEECIHCHLCSKHCPMSLEVEEMVKSNSLENSECILCGNCVDRCPKDVLRYTW